jgi:hypothetical protein
MISSIQTVRRRIEAQGFCGLDDSTYAEINYPLRLSPAICMLWAAIGTISGSAAILWALAPFAVLGAILPKHPFDVIYDHGLRHLLAKPALPRYGFRRHLACAEATAIIVGAAWSFQAGMLTTGHILGWALVTSAFINVSTGFCVPSFIVRVLSGKVACQQ